MAMTRWDPWGEVAALQRDMQALLGRSVGQAAGRMGLVPAIDAHRTAEELVVDVELPGMRPGDVEVAVEDGVLTIRGERTRRTDVEDDAWVRRERMTGAFERSFTLAEGTDPSRISASFSDGVLELRIPHPEQRRPHRVEINTGDTAGQTVEVGTGQ